MLQYVVNLWSEPYPDLFKIDQIRQQGVDYSNKFDLFSFLAVDHLFPEFDIWSDFLVRERIEALNLDILESSHPIEIPGGVTHPGQVIF
jgi:hypothetical protein